MKELNLKSSKQRGFILTSEAVLLSTVMVIGMTTGLVTLRDAMNAELEDVAEAIGSLDQTYSFDGITNGEGTAAIAGSEYGDGVDTNAGDGVTFSFVPSDGVEGEVLIAPVNVATQSASNTGSL